LVVTDEALSKARELYRRLFPCSQKGRLQFQNYAGLQVLRRTGFRMAYMDAEIGAFYEAFYKAIYNA
jgi:hypothetical protein